MVMDYNPAEGGHNSQLAYMLYPPVLIGKREVYFGLRAAITGETA